MPSFKPHTKCLVKKKKKEKESAGAERSRVVATCLWLVWILSRSLSYWFSTKGKIWGKRRKNERKKKRKLGLKVSLWLSECLSALLHTSRPHIFQMCWIGQEHPSAPRSPHTHTRPCARTHTHFSMPFTHPPPSTNIPNPLKTPKWVGTTSQRRLSLAGGAASVHLE